MPKPIACLKLSYSETREGKERIRRQWGVWSPELEKEVDCAALFSNPDFDASTKFGRPLLKVTRTDSVQKVCGGVWQGFDNLTKLERSKVEVVLQGGLKA